MKRRLIALLLTLVTVLGMFPATALAASNEDEALGEVNIFHNGRKVSYLSGNRPTHTTIMRIKTAPPGRYRRTA